MQTALRGPTAVREVRPALSSGERNVAEPLFVELTPGSRTGRDDMISTNRCSSLMDELAAEAIEFLTRPPAEADAVETRCFHSGADGSRGDCDDLQRRRFAYGDAVRKQ